MNNPATDRAFAGSIPQLYERFLVPLIFEPYAIDLAARIARWAPRRILEIAAGTGVLTRRLADALSADTTIIATDLNPPMLDQAKAIGTSKPVAWRQADAMDLPFDDATFDVIAIQFGAMFFPDKPKAFAEARRVLTPGGVLVFNVWDAIEHNEFADTVTRALEVPFPRDPPRFMARVPHGYCDTSVIARHLSEGGFTNAPAVETVAARSRAASPRVPAIAMCQGTPLRTEIEARDAGRLEEVTEIAAQQIERRFGAGAVDGKIQAHIVAVGR